MSRPCALWGTVIGDALAMPVHWYYSTRDIKDGYGGWLTGYTAPNVKHPTSILTLSATADAGRSNQKDEKTPVIGSVILHDRLKYWQSNDRSIHYHQGMSAGDSTLNQRINAQASKTLCTADKSRSEDDLQADVMTNFVKFMTTPGTHDDTYADSTWRTFFGDWRKEGSPTASKDIMSFVEKRISRLHSSELDHNIACISAVGMSVPFILHYADNTEDVAVRNAVRAVHLTNCSTSLDPYVELYARSLYAVLNGAPLKEVAEKALGSKLLGGSSTLKRAEKFSENAAKYDKGSESRLEVHQKAVSSFGMACYIDGSLPSTLYLAREFHDDLEAGLLTNANCGGENCGRGGTLGALLGAEAGRVGRQIPKHLKDGLKSSKEDVDFILQTWG